MKRTWPERQQDLRLSEDVPEVKRWNHRLCAGVTAVTFLAVVDDVLAQQVVVAEHHRGAQRGEVLLHPHHLLLQHRLARNLLLDSGNRRER